MQQKYEVAMCMHNLELTKMTNSNILLDDWNDVFLTTGRTMFWNLSEFLHFVKNLHNKIKITTDSKGKLLKSINFLDLTFTLQV